MGRSSKTTKGGKFMNPVDQERKLARKKELKKNKIQRENVRKASLLCQDYKELIQEMESVDKILFNPVENPDLNENVLRVKRAKMKDKLTRMIQMYEKEDQHMAKVLKGAELDYLRKRAEMKNFYEQIKRAENVDINSIMLPSEPSKQPILPPVAEIPLPSMPKVQARLPRFSSRDLKHLKPAGPPPGPPPSWKDIDDDDDDDDDDKAENPDLVRGEVERNQTSSAAGENVSEEQLKNVQSMSDKPLFPEPVIPLPPMLHVPGDLPMVPHPPPGPPPVLPMRPSGPPPSIPPRHPSSVYAYPSGSLPGHPAWPSGYVQPGAPTRFPQPPKGPVPPPGLPPSMLANKPPRQSSTEAKSGSRAAQSNQSAVISAAPQRRNLKEESTIFMPTAVRIRRENRQPAPSSAQQSAPKSSNKKNTADDAFNAFMEEIKTLM